MTLGLSDCLSGLDLVLKTAVGGQLLRICILGFITHAQSAYDAWQSAETFLKAKFALNTGGRGKNAKSQLQLHLGRAGRSDFATTLL